MAVLDPVKLIITNYEDWQTEELISENGPDESMGTRLLPFSKELWIEREDFMEQPSKKYFRLGPGLMVRLKNAYIIKCEDFIKDKDENITEIHCTYIPETKSGNDTSGIHVKGTIHWISVQHAVSVQVNLYDRLFCVEDPGNEERDFEEYINPESLQIVKEAFVEPDLLNAEPGRSYQFIRKGYFCLDIDSEPGKLVFNRTVTLRDNWAKEVKRS